VPLPDFTYKIAQRAGVGLEVLADFHNHMVLVELGEDGGHLALAESVVERVVNVGHGDAEARGGVAIDDQLRPKPWSCKSLATSVTIFSRLSSSTILRV
jgi:hypothetical protein